MKATDVVARRLLDAGVTHVFGISGGASLHIIHSIYELDGIEFHCLQHEQACGFAADSYARLNGIGCAVATSGPGASNLATPIIASYYDSIPVIYVVGNVTTFRMASQFANPPRGYGFQEIPFVEMMKPVVKYAVEVLDPARVRYELDRCIAQAKAGRPGPTLLSLPDDVQRAEIA